MAGISIGILTSGGDCPGLNAAIRGVGKPAMDQLGWNVIGFRDGFRGLIENRHVHFGHNDLSGILTVGGTILGTSRDKPHKFPVGGQYMDMTDVVIENYHKQHLSCLVCLGGGGTQKNAKRLAERGLNVVTLPKTIDNDVAETDLTFGFDTAMATAAEAIDKLHSTAESHQRIMIVEIMGHNTGWLALGSGIAGGADVILIPEIPYSIDIVGNAILERSRKGKKFSIVAVAEGARPVSPPESDDVKSDGKSAKKNVVIVESVSTRIARELQEYTGLDTRTTTVGYLQRGGIPSPADRLLATQFGATACDLIERKKFGVMVGIKGMKTFAVPLDKVAGNRKNVPLEHPWVMSARMVGTCLGDE
jgi:ATP-dependent phosphofructokinase / diphosphate-dependent phosphofructokinase